MHVCSCCGQEIDAVGLKISPTISRVSSESGEVRLGPVRLAILSKLLQHFPNPVSSERLERYIYGVRFKDTPIKGVLRANVYHLRKDLAPLGYTIFRDGRIGWALRPLQQNIIR